MPPLEEELSANDDDASIRPKTSDAKQAFNRFPMDEKTFQANLLEKLAGAESPPTQRT
jgi:hypothetical protein